MNLLPILQNDTALLKRFHQNSFFFGPSQTQDAPSPSGALLSPDSLSLRLPSSSASSFLSKLGRSTWDFEKYAYFRTPRFSLERR